MTVRTFRGPMRSPSHPLGNCPSAYASVNALNTQPIAVLLNPNSFVMPGAATEMLLRSMYVIRYMKLIRISTSQRSLVGFAAEFSSMVALAEADVRFMSGILAPVVLETVWRLEK